MTEAEDLRWRLEQLYFGDQGLFRGIEATLDSACVHSALILIYTLVDISATLDLPAKKRNTSGTDFVWWCETYMKCKDSLGISGNDLWVARCGVVHALAGALDKASAKAKSEGIVEIHYAYGNQPVIPSMLLSSLDPPAPRLMLHLDFLLQVLKLAVGLFIDRILHDEEKMHTVAERLQIVFSNVPSRREV